MSEQEEVEKEELNKRLTINYKNDWLNIDIVLKIRCSEFDGLDIKIKRKNNETDITGDYYRYYLSKEYEERIHLNVPGAIDGYEIEYTKSFSKSRTKYPDADDYSGHTYEITYRTDYSVGPVDCMPCAWEDEFVTSDEYYEKWENNNISAQDVAKMINELLAYLTDNVYNYNGNDLTINVEYDNDNERYYDEEDNGEIVNETINLSQIVKLINEILSNEIKNIAVKVEDLEKED